MEQHIDVAIIGGGPAGRNECLSSAGQSKKKRGRN